MNVKFYIDRNNKANDTRTIWAYISEKNEKFFLHTNSKIDRMYWDTKRQRASIRKTKDKILQGRLKSLNSYLNEFENQLYAISSRVREKNIFATFDEIEEEIKRQFKKDVKGFYDYFNDFIITKRTSVSQETIQKYERIKTILGEFEKKYDYKLSFEKITLHFYDKFFPYLVNEKNMLNNTAHKQIQFFKTFLIWANQRGLTKNTAYQHFKSKSEENEIIYLTEKELMMLYNFDFENDRLERARDLFVFQCFTGVRYSDIQNMDHSDIKGAVWKLRTQKTRSIIEIPLNGYALSILAKYKEWGKPLPIISNQKMNNYLKELCEKAGINEQIKIVKYQGNKRKETLHKKYEIVGSHTARRTFISLSLEKGMKPDVIMAITGHKSYKMMQKYLKIAGTQKRDEMDKVWGSPLRILK
ncbi:MAG: tyrosine-type recombinase/integrase [Melioribacteraceae bacterium]